jgi:molybdopterin/thiamine biosynthesis adenylyltransferase/rhodanese-related sulfurtransferase
MAAPIEVEPKVAWQMLGEGWRLLDLREPHETVLGSPSLAQHMPLSLHADWDGSAQPSLLLCQSGTRSQLAQKRWQTTTTTPLVSVLGGYRAWQQAGLPSARSSELSSAEYTRYARQLILPSFGVSTQLKLKHARVLLIGAGGLGSPITMYLAAAGVGQLTIVDGDRVELSNLHRQIIHTSLVLGEAKARSAHLVATAINPEVNVISVCEAVDLGNVESLLSACDVVIDASDNFPTRYLLADTAVRLQKPLIFGAVHRMSGQLCVFDARHGPCYRCLHPEPPGAEAAPNCSEAGVLGVVPGIIGVMQANECIKLLTGIGSPLLGQLFLLDCATMQARTVRIPKDPQCPSCSTDASMLGTR